MNQDMNRQPEGRLLCHHYLFHRLIQEDIASFLQWMHWESPDSLFKLYQFSQDSPQIQLITCIDSHHRAIGLLTVYPPLLTVLKSQYKLTEGEYYLENLQLYSVQSWDVRDLAHLLLCYMRYLINELQCHTLYWEIRREDQQFRTAAELAGFTRVLSEERLFVLYAYAG
ncbi:hypothetical protein [Paraflavitalea pollutisoli]|uniref:hypothetical protein n=1 Tax=Paraflavitalea pollutisoli TaxID=3034143 RepID=UPI0023ECAE9D|nr:hypothetical protein [Paraflavitalea sp. H1-2-19X]